MNAETTRGLDVRRVRVFGLPRKAERDATRYLRTCYISLPHTDGGATIDKWVEITISPAIGVE